MARSFQVVQLFGRMSVRENLLLAGQRCHDSGILSSLLGLKTNAVADRRNAAAADWLLNEAGLYAQRHKPAATLPYGRQRILEVARALATQPKLILLDEPAAGLNTGEAFELADYLRKIRNRGVTILVVEHNMPFVLGLADSIVVLDSGQKIADDVPDVIQCDERVIASYLGTPAPEAIDA
jgi:branched-chain amino acid transport system ATP-binding protein